MVSTAYRRGGALLVKTVRQFQSTPRNPSAICLSSPLPLHQSSRFGITFRQFCQIPQLLQQAEASLLRQQETIEEDIQEHIPPLRSGTGRDAHRGQITRFQELADQQLIDHDVIRTITKRMRLETMTEVQSLTIRESLSGSDILAQAKTGTGKTVAFLLPIIQNILKRGGIERRRQAGQTGGSNIQAIVISPTRELAEQIAVEARKLCSGTDIKVQTAVGGTGKRYALKQMNMFGCHLLIGTPGRLLDILTDPSSGARAPNLHTLVLDEADRLLDQGFQEAIQDIQKLLPDRRSVNRQTLLYSATVPREVMSIVNETLKPNYKLIRTVKQGEAPTHERVPQMQVVTAGVQNMLPALLELCKREVSAAMAPGSAKAPFKAIVYLNSTANVSLAASIFRNLRESQGPNVGGHPLGPIKSIEIHSKLTQQGRTYASESFRRAKSAILFSSDITARGMDFPGVTHIIQLGTPSSEETYIHRIGRTARGNSAGESWIILADFEVRMAKQRLHNLPIRPDSTLATAKVDMTKEVELPANVAENLTQVSEATLLVDRETKVKAYHAFLGAYSSLRDRQRLVDSLSNWVKYGWGWKEPPTISPVLVQKLGFQHVTGLNIGRLERTRSEGESTRFRDSNGFGGEGYNKGANSRVTGRFGSRERGGHIARGGFPREGRDFRSRGSGGYSEEGSFSEKGRELFGDRGIGGFSNRGSPPRESRAFGSKGRGGHSSGSRGGPDKDRYRSHDRRGGERNFGEVKAWQ
ncbi:MAG: hypothetical protein M1840_007953 [Geoglossum simile]|nr:MAG: hypothetical protein M1840_007953 [Geoglossum simile]